MGFEHSICQVEFAEFLIVVDLFGGVLFFGCDFVGVEVIGFFGVDLLLDFLEGFVGHVLLLSGVVGIHVGSDSS